MTLTIQQAAATTGWSPRMLRYIEQLGLVVAPRSAAGHRTYGAGQLQRLRTLRGVLQQFDLELGDVGFARRLRTDSALSTALDEWFETVPARPAPVAPMTDDDWLALEQAKHEQLLHPHR